MKILRAANNLKPGRSGVCLAIGFFDGVHLGHQQIIRQTISDARHHDALAVVVTFDRHPNAVVAPARVPPLIHSLPQKLRTIASLGADALLLLHFGRRLSEQCPKAFVCGLDKSFGHIRSICVGANFRFGHRRAGSVALLKQLGSDLGFAVHGIAAVSLNGQAVSSTRIRKAIQLGKLDAASQMLGRSCSFSGTIGCGNALGRKLGYPTANVAVDSLVLPPTGVYAVQATVRGETHCGVLNIGVRPTLRQAKSRLQAEVHLLGYHGTLYGQEMEVTFVEKLRGERKFPSLAALQEQIARDIVRARRCFHGEPIADLSGGGRTHRS